MYEFRSCYYLSNNLPFIPSQITASSRKNNFEIERRHSNTYQIKICALLSHWIRISIAMKNFLLQAIAKYLSLNKSAFSFYSEFKTNVEIEKGYLNTYQM